MASDILDVSHNSRPSTPPPMTSLHAEEDGVIGIISRDSYSPMSVPNDEPTVNGYRSRSATWPIPGDPSPPEFFTPEPLVAQRDAPMPATAQQPSPTAAEAIVGVEGVRLSGRGMPVETAWSVELPRLPPDFSIDVELSNGLTIVIRHSRRHVDGRWFVVAKDAANRRHFVARFQRHRAWSPYHTALRILGSPFAGDVSSLLVLLLATLLTFVAGDGNDDADRIGTMGDDADQHRAAWRSSLRRGYYGAGPRAGDPNGSTRGEAALTRMQAILQAFLHLLALTLGLEGGSLDLSTLLRVALLAALALALCSRLVGKVYERFPPRSEYTLSVATRAGVLESDMGTMGDTPAGSWLTRARQRGGGEAGEEEDGERESLMVAMSVAYKNAICNPPSGSKSGAASKSSPAGLGASAGVTPSKANGCGAAGDGGDSAEGASSESHDSASGGLTGELDLLVGPLLDAIQKSLAYGDVFGPLMVLAVKNDEGNLRKARKAWEKYAEEDPRRAMTLRGLLEMEKEAGIHKPGAVLADPSAAIALLWMRRTLQFLGQCLSGVLDDAASMNEVGANAYKIELEPFHGWLLKNTFAMALNGMPRRDEIYMRLGGHLPEENREALLRAEVAECVHMLRQVADSMRNLFEQLGLEDMRKV